MAPIPVQTIDRYSVKLSDAYVKDLHNPQISALTASYTIIICTSNELFQKPYVREHQIHPRSLIMKHTYLHYLGLIFITLFSLFMVAHLTGCNTIEGAGQDIQRTGETIEDAADDNK
jgi:entericidin A